MNQKVLSEEEEDAMVPDEFSNASGDDMEEFMEHEEHFEVKPSVSSRASMPRGGKGVNYGGKHHPTQMSKTGRSPSLMGCMDGGKL